MLISTQKLCIARILFFVLILYISSFNNVIYSQCNLTINNIVNPSSCYASDGSMAILATDQPGNPCERQIHVYRNGNLIAQGSESLVVNGLISGDYQVIANDDCGCITVQTQLVLLTGGNPSLLTPYVNLGLGRFQGNYVFVCRGSNVDLGIQSLGFNNLQITGPGGFSDSTPDGNSFWTFTNVQPSLSGIYTIKYTNSSGCVSSTNITLTVGTLNVNLGPDRAACIGTEHLLKAIVSGQSECTPTCPGTLDSLLVNWSLDQCNANGQSNQNDYSELIPSFPSLGNCLDVSASNIYRLQGEHSCTPVLGSYSGDVGICIPAMDSCDPANYNPENAIRFEVTLTPSEAGRITGLSFNEQSPFNWMTTNGSKGPNNYNTKYLIRVYKNNLLIYSEDDRLTERNWNIEKFDFSTNPAFAITDTTVFRFELRGYCVVQSGGNMSGWELDDVKIFGGCCSGLVPDNSISYLWSTGETTSSIIVNPSVTTNYSVLVTDCNSCQFSDNVNITVYPLPVPVISGVKSVCTGGSTVLTASGGVSYLWSTGATTASITLIPLSTDIYSVTVTSVNGCNASGSVEVIVNPLPSPVITGDLEICLGESTTLTASGGVNYEWSTGAFGASITVSPLINTTYMVMATDANGCQDYTTVLVVVNKLPNSAISGNNVICKGNFTTLTASGGTNYLWNNGATTAEIIVNPVDNITYTVTVSDVNSCSKTSQISIVVNPLPIAIISGNSTFCIGKSSLLTASGGITFEWSTGATSTSIMVNPGLNTIYTVTVTDSNGCTSSASRMANVMSLPEATIIGDKKICLGDEATLTASGGITYLWNTGSTNNIISTSPTVTTIYRVTVTDTNGCTGTSAHAVVVNSNPEVLISGNNKFCIGSSTTLSTNVTGTTFCDDDCIDELLFRWDLDACNFDGLSNQLSYAEFIGTLVTNGGFNSLSANNVRRDLGDHSCTPDGTGGVGICFGALDSCDPNEYNPLNGLKFSVTLNPNEIGKLTKLTFREQSPLMWMTTNGSTGINNYNEKYLIRVHKDGVLIYSRNDLPTERIWNTEIFDFTDHPYFSFNTEATFTFEIYGYCTVDRG
ncbi:MAG: hypothetical protein H7X99_02020 [Saprospiraceae bacterium]|nr:hypothetical protein [Saprospiraceae bacterium]